MKKNDLDEYQAFTATTLKPQCNNAEYLTLGLCGESGEVAEKIKRIIRGDGTIDETLIYELGDVLYYIARLAAFYHVSLSKVAQMNVEKLTKRMADNKIQGKGDKR